MTDGQPVQSDYGACGVMRIYMSVPGAREDVSKNGSKAVTWTDKSPKISEPAPEVPASPG